MRTRFITSGLFVLVLGGVLLAGRATAQTAPTATPALMQLPSVTPLPLPDEAEQAQPEEDASGADEGGLFAVEEDGTGGQVLLEVDSEVNVRSSPEISDENRLGTISPGQRYVVLGRYFEWYEFQYDLSPTGTAWVYSDLVSVSGDESQVPNLDFFAEPTADEVSINATATREALLAQPGGVLTVTAQSRVIQLPGANGQAPAAAPVDAGPTVLPTFTYPPGVALVPPTRDASGAPTPEVDNRRLAAREGVPAIVPIMLLGVGGLIGLMLSSSRG